ncbi:hypothetical protein Tcan_02064, partial [Toxocara canis]
YVLKKDLLKFEAIYPNDQKPITTLRNGVEVYPRSSVHHLQGSLNWIKQARSIKVHATLMLSLTRWRTVFAKLQCAASSMLCSSSQAAIDSFFFIAFAKSSSKLAQLDSSMLKYFFLHHPFY